ncbi:ABC transporter family protein [Aspergillus niger]|uniref:ABC transporter family protein n=1 Tax=Aspergillus niger TaxID=5061 RepID=A0A505HXX2_ASPNG|nr:ABC transporter family protein [Aspergillus niger]
MWTTFLSVAAGLASLPLTRAFNNPPGVDIWCGKAYRASNASFNPGGWFEQPSYSSTPLLNLKVRPRMSIYLETDAKGSLLVDTTVSHLVGDPLPRTDGGSATRIDHRTGMLSYIRNQSVTWTPIFPYTYYAQWSLYWDTNTTTLTTFASQGYNVIHIVPTGTLSDTPFPWSTFTPYLTSSDMHNLHLQYDVLFDPTNLTKLTDQVSHIHTHPSLLLYYTADEPDGKSNPLNSTRLAYDLIRSMDPYHPVSLALNCKDFYYEEYASGADIILSDVYPISTNTSWSTVYDTPCNATYGCCGCDDCAGEFEDISDRLNQFYDFDGVIGWEKVHWGAPQAFGEETFWTRYPTAEEEVVMVMLSVNHGAMGIVMWDYPSSGGIERVTRELAPVVTGEVFVGFLDEGVRGEGVVRGAKRVDVAGWVVEEGKALVSVLNLNYGGTGEVRVGLEGVRVAGVESVLWGGEEWVVKDGELVREGLRGLEVCILVVDLV